MIIGDYIQNINHDNEGYNECFEEIENVQPIKNSNLSEIIWNKPIIYAPLIPNINNTESFGL